MAPPSTQLTPLAGRLQRLARVIAVGGAIAGLAIVIAWQLGIGESLALGPDQIPTAPGTGLLLLLVGLALATGRDGPDGTRHTPLSRALTIAALLLSATYIIATIVGYDLPFERALAGSTETRGALRIGRTSIVTAILFGILATILLSRRNDRPHPLSGSILALLLAVTSVILQGYALGQPLLFGTRIIPVAAPTATTLFAVALAALLQLGPNVWPTRLFVPEPRESTRPPRRGFLSLAVLLSAVVLSSGFFWYDAEVRDNEEQTSTALSTVAAAKAQVLATWYDGHRTTAVAVNRRLQASAEVVRQAQPSASAADRRAVSQWLFALLGDQDFERVELFDSERRSIAFVERDADQPPMGLERLLRVLPAADTVIMQDLYRSDAPNLVVFWAPLPRQPGSDPRPGAWIALATTAQQAILPRLRDLPARYRTGAIALLRSTADSVHRIPESDATGTGVNRLTASRADPRALLAMALRTTDTTFEAMDDGEELYVAARPVPGTPWFVMATVDRAEIRGPVVTAALRATVLSLAFLLSIAALVYALWYRRELGRTERELQLIADRERSIAEVERNAATLRRSERLLRMRSAVNQALVRAEHESELFQIVCDIGVREGGYRMAWIGLKQDDDAFSVRPVAVAGDERGYLSLNPLSWGTDAHGMGPTGRCIRSGEPQAAQDLLAESNYAPWRAAAMERGYQSSLSVPITVGGEVIGALMLYASEPHAFDTDELTLVAQVGQDLSYGVGALRDHEMLETQRAQLILFRQAIDRSADAIYVADVATGRFVDFNLEVLDQLGYTAEEMLQIGPADIVPDLGARGGIAQLATNVKSAGGIVRLSKHRRKDGRELPIEVALSVLEVGARTLILGIARDISDRLRSEQERAELQTQLTRSQRLESVGRLAGGVAHDFNNLLTVITTSAELAQLELPATHPAAADLHEIRNASERAARLTRQLLAFSRQQVLKREVLQLNETVSHFLTMLSRVIGEDIHVSLKLGSRVPPIFADAGQLEQVLMNLCVNARDAMPRGGTLTIETSEQMVDAPMAATLEGITPGAYAVLSVRDTGIGMDEATQAKIFEPFFTTKELGHGTGLGLSTVYGIVKQSGGSITVSSTPGAGTAFRVLLPSTTEVAEPPSGATAVATRGGSETILLVEDESSIRMASRRVLERAGYTVLEAESGLAALALLERSAERPDLIMTDLVMPGMTGMELAEQLRRDRPSLKVLFTSGYSADVVSDRLPLGEDLHFISKPYGVNELLSEVRRMLDG